MSEQTVFCIKKEKPPYSDGFLYYRFKFKVLNVKTFRPFGKNDDDG